jgi:hypothetical protein
LLTDCSLFFILITNTPLVWVCIFSGLFIKCKLKGLQPPGKRQTITRKIVTPEIQKNLVWRVCL